MDLKARSRVFFHGLVASVILLAALGVAVWATGTPPAAPPG